LLIKHEEFILKKELLSIDLFLLPPVNKLFKEIDLDNFLSWFKASFFEFLLILGYIG